MWAAALALSLFVGRLIDVRAHLAQATATLSSVLEIAPHRGTWLSEGEPDGIVIAWSLWQARFGGREERLGAPVEIGGRRRVLRCRTTCASRADAAIRLALGADRRHLVRQALAEAAIPAAGGLLVAIALTVPIQSAAACWLPPELLRGSALTFDWPVLAFGSCLAVVLLTILSSLRYLVNPWRNTREALSVGGASQRGSRRTGGVVLALQTGCAAALLYLGSLAATSLTTLQQSDLDFNPPRLLFV